jgi:hypothetical protein
LDAQKFVEELDYGFFSEGIKECEIIDLLSEEQVTIN